MVALQPAWRSARAAARPPMPPPMMATSSGREGWWKVEAIMEKSEVLRWARILAARGKSRNSASGLPGFPHAGLPARGGAGGMGRPAKGLERHLRVGQRGPVEQGGITPKAGVEGPGKARQDGRLGAERGGKLGRGMHGSERAPILP